jgi:hypothetical protein
MGMTDLKDEFFRTNQLPIPLFISIYRGRLTKITGVFDVFLGVLSGSSCPL